MNLIIFNICERKVPFRKRYDESQQNFMIFFIILLCPLADRSEKGRIAYCFMRSCLREARWPGMKDQVPSGTGDQSPWRYHQQPLKWEAPCESWERMSPFIIVPISSIQGKCQIPERNQRIISNLFSGPPRKTESGQKEINSGLWHVYISV